MVPKFTLNIWILIKFLYKLVWLPPLIMKKINSWLRPCQYAICWFVFCAYLGMWRWKVRAVEIWRKQRAERGVIMPRYYSFRGEEIAKTKGEDFLCACWFEKWKADRELLLAVLCRWGTELQLVLVSTYTDGTSVFRYQRAHKVRKKHGIDTMLQSDYLWAMYQHVSGCRVDIF